MGVWVEWFLRKIECLSFRGGYLKVIFWFHYVSVVEGLWVCKGLCFVLFGGSLGFVRRALGARQGRHS